MNQIASRSQHRFEGAVAIVTGGTKGIGRGIAQAFLEAGAEVIVCARHAPEQPVQAAGRSATFLPCDVCNPGSVAEFVQLVVDRHGRIDVLVNNAGGAPSGESGAESPDGNIGHGMGAESARQRGGRGTDKDGRGG